MGMNVRDEPLPPLMPFIKRQDDGTPYLAGAKCKACGHVFVGERTACAKCTARDQMQSVHLALTGKLYVYTIVYRDFPGVKTPFIDAIVDLDDGAHLKGTLIGVSPDPDSIAFDLPVKVSFREVEPVNQPGTPYLSYVFEPQSSQKG